ncbi:MAG: hypothetical protein LBK94_04465 [Prevotellaceae bacterium]|jgi:hypothetical protein|nr:hypothetical protein [Prevotellaceae bacterium]
MNTDTSLRYYSFFVCFNPFNQSSEFGKIGTKAQQYYSDFLNNSDYGDNLLPVNFQFFVEKEVDLDRQYDNVSVASYFGVPASARLNLHFEYDFFISSDGKTKYKMTVNGILFLLKYWYKNLKNHKDTPLEKIIEGFENQLKIDNLFSMKFEKYYIKFNNGFRFSFMRHYCYGIRYKQILFDTNDIEKFLNNSLYKTDFGKSIKEIFFSYDIFDFDNQGHKQYIDNEKEYKYGKSKDLCIMEQYDSNLFIYNSNFYDKTKESIIEYLNKAKREQIEYLHKGMLNAIGRIGQMKRKPKDFDYQKFGETIDKLMTEYEQIEENKSVSEK